MINQQKPSILMQIALWTAQGILAASLIWAAAMKLFYPVEELAAMWPWTGQVSTILVRFTGVIDLLGGMGLVLPALLQKQLILIPIAALAIITLMISAAIFHITRGEASLIGVNIVFAFIAAFIAWGGLKKAPATSK